MGRGSDAPYLLRGPWDSAQTPPAYLTGKPNGKTLEARHASILTTTVLTSGWFSERQNGESDGDHSLPFTKRSLCPGDQGTGLTKFTSKTSFNLHRGPYKEVLLSALYR